MPRYKYLFWDGVYAAGGGTCNQIVGDHNIQGHPEVNDIAPAAYNVGFGEGVAIAMSIYRPNVRILSISQHFAPNIIMSRNGSVAHGFPSVLK
jgi:hypothetical protein